MSIAAKKLIGTTALEQAAGGTDPETVLLLTGDGTDGDQNNTFLDSSSNNHTITRNGNVTQGTFTPFSKEEGKWGVYFDQDELTYTSPGVFPEPLAFVDNTAAGPGTIEAWIYPEQLIQSSSADHGFSTIVSVGDTYFSLNVLDNGALRYYWFDGSSNFIDSTSTVSLNEWSHVAVTVNSGEVKFWINGVLSVTQTVSSDISWSSSSAGENLQIGNNAGSGTNGWWYGYISNLRISSSIRYTENFTPSASPFTSDGNTNLLTCQSNRFVDNSSNSYPFAVSVGTPEVTTFSPFANTSGYDPAVVGGSGYFDGDGDSFNSLQLPFINYQIDSASSFIISFWVYPLELVSNNVIYSTNNGEPTNRDLSVLRLESGYFEILQYIDGSVGPSERLISDYKINIFEWTYVEHKFNSGVWTLYVNGEEKYTESGLVGPFVVTSSGFEALIGQWVDDGSSYQARDFYGYLSDFRITDDINNAGLPASPATSDNNTELLLNFTNAGIIDSLSSNVIETVGNTQIDTTVVKHGTGSMEFDGAGDYLKVTPSSSFYFGTNDFTIECWINTTVRSSDSGERRIFKLHGPASSAADQIQLLIDDNSGVIEFYSNTTVLTGTTAVDDGSWHHIALVRNSGTTTLFIDGSSEDSAADTTDYDVSTEPSPNIGSFNGTAGDFNGYIDDLRITKGLARYTTNFTPPGALI